jgi:hypothetical protein
MACQHRQYSLLILLAALLISGAGVWLCPWAPRAILVGQVVDTFGVALPIIMRGERPAPARLIQPGELVYLGAFRLPDGDARPRTFAYGGNAMTYRPDGDPSGAGDGFPGSLFITGHDRLAYGELPDGSQVAEIDIPAPAIVARPDDLPQARFVQPFSDIARDHFVELDEMPRIGLQYLDHPATGPLVHLAWGQHLQPEPPAPSHAWFRPTLHRPAFAGEWFIGQQRSDSVNGYLGAIPAAWAAAHVGGRPLVTGRFRDGGWGGMGPALYAYQPWTDPAGTPAADGAHLAEVTLLRYASSEETGQIERCLSGYQHPDEWEGIAWVATPTGKEALVFVGTKAVGTRYWYGYAHPTDPTQPCVEGAVVGEFPVCRKADGAMCPPEELVECAGHNDYRGWWSTEFVARMLFYDPADLARVAAGELDPWEPQPYATLDIDERLFHNPDRVEEDMLGVGPQRRFRLGDVAHDPVRELLFVLELFADGEKPVVHVWRISA